MPNPAYNRRYSRLTKNGRVRLTARRNRTIRITVRGFEILLSRHKLDCLDCAGVHCEHLKRLKADYLKAKRDELCQLPLIG